MKFCFISHESEPMSATEPPLAVIDPPVTQHQWRCCCGCCRMVSWPTNEWGHPGATRDDEAITGAAEAPVLTTVVEDRQLMPTLPQSGLSESQRLHAPEESIETVHGRLHNADGESALLMLPRPSTSSSLRLFMIACSVSILMTPLIIRTSAAYSKQSILPDSRISS